MFSSVFDDFGANLSYQDGDLPVAGVLQSSLDMYGRLGSDMKEEASDAKAGSIWKHLEASGSRKIGATEPFYPMPCWCAVGRKHVEQLTAFCHAQTTSRSQTPQTAQV